MKTLCFYFIALISFTLSSCGSDKKSSRTPIPETQSGFKFRSSDFSDQATQSCLESSGASASVEMQTYCRCIGDSLAGTLVEKYGGADKVPENASLSDEESAAAMNSCTIPITENPPVSTQPEVTPAPETKPEAPIEQPSSGSKFDPESFKAEVKTSCTASLEGMFPEAGTTTYCQCIADGLLQSLVGKYGNITAIPENAELSEEESERATEHCPLPEPEPIVPEEPVAPKFNVPGAKNISAGNLSLNNGYDNSVFDFTRKGQNDDYSITSTWKFNLNQASRLEFDDYNGLGDCNANSIHMVVLAATSDDVIDVLALPSKSSGNTVYAMNKLLQPGSYRLLMVIHSASQCAIATQFEANSRIN